MPGIKIADVVALAGGADERAGAAAQAGLIEVLPLGGVELLHHVLAVKAGEVEVGKRVFRHLGAGLVLGGGKRRAVGLLAEVLNGGEQLFALLGLGIQVHLVAQHPCLHVAFRLGKVDAKHGAEAGLAQRLEAAQRDHGAAVAAGLIVAVHGVGEEDAVEYVETAGVAGAHAEEYERLGGKHGVLDLDALARDAERHEILALGEEQILGGLDGHLPQRDFTAAFPEVVVDLAGALHRQVELRGIADAGVQRVRVGSFQLQHAIPPCSGRRKAPRRPW